MSLAATIVTAVSGMLVGAVLGRTVTLNLAKERLEDYATRIMNEGEASSAESRSVLAAMNASSYPPCSTTEQDYFRHLVFQSEYLKDAGRIADGRIACSATLGRLQPPFLLPKADFLQQDGTKVYRNAAPFRAGNLTVVSLQSGQADVVFSPPHSDAPGAQFDGLHGDGDRRAQPTFGKTVGRFASGCGESSHPRWRNSARRYVVRDALFSAIL